MIENYILHEQIGQGEYGKVYRATDINTQNVFAVKVVEAQKLNENPKLHELSMTEIKVLQQVNHCPYIVQFIQLIKTPLKYYFVYEYCSGGPLDKMLLLQGHLTETKALQAFKTLQQNRIMHRDLKPSNILIQNGTYKLADFGFCKPMELAFGDVTTTMLGSPIYMAPEVLRGLSYDNKADVWSLGAVLYELLIGRCPFEEKSIAKLITAQDETDWVIPPQFSFRTQTMNLMKSMLIKDAAKRCSWEYLFQQPLTKEGEFIGDVKVYEVDQPVKNYNPLQPLDNNINYTNQHSTTYQQFSLPYSPLDYQKKEPTRVLQRDPSPSRFYEPLRENNHKIDAPKKTFDSSKPPLLCRANTYMNDQSKDQMFKETQLKEVSNVTTPNLNNRLEVNVSNMTNITMTNMNNMNVPVSTENVLGEVIRERNKIFFICKVLNDITKFNLTDKAHLAAYALLLLANKRYQSLAKVAREYPQMTEAKEYSALQRLLQILQKKNSVKRLFNNFEFVRLVDTIEKEAKAIGSSTNDYKQMIDSMKVELDKRDLVVAQSTSNFITEEQAKILTSYVLSYVHSVRSQHYIAFIDYKSEADKHVVLHATDILNSLSVDQYFESVVGADEVLDDFESQSVNLEKKILSERYEELQKRVTLQC